MFSAASMALGAAVLYHELNRDDSAQLTLLEHRLTHVEDAAQSNHERLENISQYLRDKK